MSESIRIKIAKWLAPELALDISWFQQTSEYYRFGREQMMDDKHAYMRKLLQAQNALRLIRALRTPKCSHVVKKACDIADAALSHPSIPTQEAE